MSTIFLTTAGGMMGITGTVLYMGLFFVIMWFLIIRPQRKREKQMAEMQNAIKIGDSVLLQSGEYGKIVDIINDLFIIEFGLNKSVRIPVRKSAVLGVQQPQLTIAKPQEEQEQAEEEVEVQEEE